MRALFGQLEVWQRSFVALPCKGLERRVRLQHPFSPTYAHVKPATAHQTRTPLRVECVAFC
jgi:hypothetical protein